MSLFFQSERRQPAVVPDPPTTTEVESALVILSQGKSTTIVGGILRSHDLAERLHAECRKAEAALLAGVADGSVTTKAQAVACVQAATVEKFPVSKFLAIIQANVGTWAETIAAAREEAGV